LNIARMNGRDISVDHISKRLENIHTGTTTEKDTNLRKAAVLIPLLIEKQEWCILYTHRTDNVQDHKGQVSFPGGAVELTDATIEETALRETYEEIGILPSDISVLGKLQEYSTITKYRITPVVGFVSWPRLLILSPIEVSHCFTIPVSWLLNKDNRTDKLMTFADGRTESVLFYKPYNDEIVWGATARLTFKLLELLVN
jgi:8-oxo-dGTP pyrophosphatase MutT (NUDIX family)